MPEFENQSVRVVAYTQPEYLSEYLETYGYEGKGEEEYLGPKDTEELIGFAAKVSNPAKQHEDSSRLLSYLRNHAHWSPFEMASMTLEFNTTRDIGRQLLRHRSFSFQEFSQRYAEVLDPFVIREARSQDLTNRQASHDDMDEGDKRWFEVIQEQLGREIEDLYRQALKRGIAKECARAILPEGMTSSKIYVAGTVRSWMHYIDLRSANGTQLEHQDLAIKANTAIAEYLPNLFQMEETTND